MESAAVTYLLRADFCQDHGKNRTNKGTVPVFLNHIILHRHSYPLCYLLMSKHSQILSAFIEYFTTEMILFMTFTLFCLMLFYDVEAKVRTVTFFSILQAFLIVESLACIQMNLFECANHRASREIYQRLLPIRPVANYILIIGLSTRTSCAVPSKPRKNVLCNSCLR